VIGINLKYLFISPNELLRFEKCNIFIYEEIHVLGSWGEPARKNLLPGKNSVNNEKTTHTGIFVGGNVSILSFIK
jgi:hypothetical protein